MFGRSPIVWLARKRLLAPQRVRADPWDRALSTLKVRVVSTLKGQVVRVRTAPDLKGTSKVLAIVNRDRGQGSPCPVNRVQG